MSIVISARGTFEEVKIYVAASWGATTCHIYATIYAIPHVCMKCTTAGVLSINIQNQKENMLPANSLNHDEKTVVQGY